MPLINRPDRFKGGVKKGYITANKRSVKWYASFILLEFEIALHYSCNFFFFSDNVSMQG